MARRSERNSRRRLLAGVFSIWLILVAPALAQEAKPAPEPAPALAQVEAFASPIGVEPFDAGELFDRVVATLHKKYFDPDQMARELWVERANAARDDVVGGTTPAGAIARINALLAELKASHLHLHSPDDLAYYFLLDLSPNAPGARALIERRFWGSRPNFASIGAFTTEISGRHFIDGLLEGSPASRAGLKTGDEIAEVEGAPYHQIKSFRGKVGSEVRVGYHRTADSPRAFVQVPVVSIVPRIAFEMATAASTRIIERDGRRIGYFRIWAQMEQRPILQAMARLSPGGSITIMTPGRDQQGLAESASASTIRSELGPLTDKPLDAILVDMRGKIGGTDHSQMLLGLLDQGTRGENFFYRGRQRDAPGAQREAPPPRNQSFRGRAAMLIDHHTRSAGEMVAWSFKHAGMGPLVGSPTRGHVLASQIEVMPGGLILQIPVARPEADGVVLEGKGVAPDIWAEHPLPYSSGADPVLEAALQQLSPRPAKPQGASPPQTP